LSQLKYGVVLSYVSMGVGVVVSLLSTPLILRTLGQSEWGLYQLVASVVGYLGLLSFGFGSAYVRFYARAVASDDQDAVGKLNGLFLVVFLTIGAVAAVIGLILVFNARAVLGDKLTSEEISTAQVLIGVMTMTVALSFPASVFNSFVTANERFLFQRVLGLIRVLATPILSVLVVLLGFKSVGMALVVAAVAVAHAIASLAYSVRRLEMRFTTRGLDASLLREIAVFSSYLFIYMVVDQANWSVDKFILGRFQGTAAVAVYALAASLNAHYVSISSTVSGVFIPRVNRLVVVADDNVELTRLLTRVGRIQFMILTLIASGLIVFGRPFIAFWVGPGFSDAYPILLLLVIPVTVPLIQNLGIEIQKAKNMHQFRAWTYAGIAVLNVLVSIPLAQRYGGIGAAFGTAASLLLGNGLLMNWYYHRRVGLDMKYFWKSIAALMPALIPVALLGVAIMAFVDFVSPWILALWLLAFAMLYCSCIWLLGMNDSEKDLIRRPLVRLFRRRLDVAR